MKNVWIHLDVNACKMRGAVQDKILHGISTDVRKNIEDNVRGIVWTRVMNICGNVTRKVMNNMDEAKSSA